MNDIGDFFWLKDVWSISEKTLISAILCYTESFFVACAMSCLISRFDTLNCCIKKITKQSWSERGVIQMSLKTEKNSRQSEFRLRIKLINAKYLITTCRTGVNQHASVWSGECQKCDGKQNLLECLIAWRRYLHKLAPSECGESSAIWIITIFDRLIWFDKTPVVIDLRKFQIWSGNSVWPLNYPPLQTTSCQIACLPDS